MRIGLAASVLIHLWIVLLNPRMSSDYATGSAAPAALAQGRSESGQLVDFVISATARPAPVVPTPPKQTRESVTSRSSAAVSAAAPTVSSPVGVPGGTGSSTSSTGSAVPNRGDPDPGTRLRYRPGPVWTPPPPRVESCAQRVRREITERIAAGIADRNVGVVPPSSEPQKKRFEAGIRIPFGPKPPGPAVTVPPPPPPDSFRSVLKPQRDTVNPPLFAQDSIRCAEQDRVEATLRARPDTVR